MSFDTWILCHQSSSSAARSWENAANDKVSSKIGTRIDRKTSCSWVMIHEGDEGGGGSKRWLTGAESL